MDPRKKVTKRPSANKGNESGSTIKIKMDEGADILHHEFGVNGSRDKAAVNVESIDYSDLVRTLDAEKILTELLDCTIENFVDVRNFLGIQLDHALGNIDDTDFEIQKKIHLSKLNKIDDATLKLQLKALLYYLEREFSVDDLSGLFNCSSKKIETALEALEKEFSGVGD